MAISPPSDIVLDVARAVEPEALQTARTELAKRAGSAASGVAGAFSLIEDGATAGAASTKSTTPESFRKFEAMVLQTFVQGMLPKDSEATFGKGLAGDMWKQLLSQEVATVMADRGGIGIADRVLGDFYKRGEKAVPVGGVSGGPVHADRDSQASLSSALVQELQRKITRAITDDAATPSKPSALQEITS